MKKKQKTLNDNNQYMQSEWTTQSTILLRYIKNN